MDITTSTLHLDTSDGKMETYEARPKEGGVHPAIIVIMEAFGLNNHIRDVTGRVAAAGYVAIAPDLYHREPERTAPYTNLQKAIGLMNRLQDPKVMGDVGTVISHLKSQSYVKAGSMGVTGFCMGGRFTYLTAAHHNKDITAAVVFYGGGIPMGKPSPLERTGEINCPMQLFFGGKDPLIPPEHVEMVNKALTDQKKDFKLKLYPDATHGFFCNERESYHPESAKDAWELFKSFFAQHLK
ncbi:MAG: dienelactone hydrolase family protein [Candidatus Binatia bacterium]